MRIVTFYYQQQTFGSAAPSYILQISYLGEPGIMACCSSILFSSDLTFEEHHFMLYRFNRLVL